MVKGKRKKRRSDTTGWLEIDCVSKKLADWYMGQPDMALIIRNDKVPADKISNVYYRRRVSAKKIKVFFNQKLKK
jgi:hypothetical protein